MRSENEVRARLEELREAVVKMRALDAGFDEGLNGYNDAIDDVLRLISKMLGGGGGG